MEVIREFGDTTTMHGVQKIAKAKYKRLRVFWVIAILCAIGMFIFQLYLLIDQYLRRPTRTTMELSRDSVRFPDVSVCNMRNIDIDVMYSLYKQFALRKHPYELIQWTNITRASPEFEISFLKLVGEYYMLYVHHYTKYSEMFGTLFSRSNMVGNFGKETMIKGAVPPWELTLRCSWQGAPCYNSNFSTFYDTYYSNCVTFRAPTEKIGSEGAESGLSFVALVGSGMINWTSIASRKVLVPGLQENNYPLAGDGGLRVVIHPPGSHPLPSIEGYDVPPGFSGSFALKVTNNSILGQPYGNCSTNYIDEDGYSYRVLNCLRKCIQKHIIARCNCVDARLPFDDEMVKNNLFCGKVAHLSPQCHLSSNINCIGPLEDAANNITCAKTVAADLISRETLVGDCNCFPPCKETLYDLTYSLAKWPVDHETDFVYQELLLQDKFFEKLNASNASALKIGLYNEYFQFHNREKNLQQFAKINVYFADLTITKTKQVPDYNVIDLMSDIGGNMGLWLGMSVLTLTEFLQLGLDLCIHGKSSKSTTKVQKMKNISRISVIPAGDMKFNKTLSRENLIKQTHGSTDRIYYREK